MPQSRAVAPCPLPLPQMAAIALGLGVVPDLDDLTQVRAFLMTFLPAVSALERLVSQLEADPFETVSRPAWG